MINEVQKVHFSMTCDWVVKGSIKRPRRDCTSGQPRVQTLRFKLIWAQLQVGTTCESCLLQLKYLGTILGVLWLRELSGEQRFHPSPAQLDLILLTWSRILGWENTRNKRLIFSTLLFQKQNCLLLVFSGVAFYFPVTLTLPLINPTSPSTTDSKNACPPLLKRVDEIVSQYLIL